MMKTVLSSIVALMCVIGCTVGDHRKIAAYDLAAWAAAINETPVTCTPSSPLVRLLRDRRNARFPLSELTNCLPVTVKTAVTDPWGRGLLVEVTDLDESKADLICQMTLVSRGPRAHSTSDDLVKRTTLRVFFPDEH